MFEKITSKLVNSLKPQTKPYEVRDSLLKGLLLRVQPSGVMTYYLEYKRGKRIKIGRADALSPDEARSLARNELVGVFKGIDPADQRRHAKAYNFLTYLEEVYKPWLLSNLRRGEATYKDLKVSFPELHPLKLSEISPWVMEKWRARRLNEGIKPSTVNRSIDNIKACLNRAVEWGILEEHPIAKVKRSKVDRNPAPRFLSDEEEVNLRKVLDARELRLRAEREAGNQWRAVRKYPLLPSLKDSTFADHLKPAVLLALNTGLRRSELFRLTWSAIDFENKILTVTGITAKTGTTRHIPLSEEAYEILCQLKRQPGVKSQYVFTGADGKPLHDARTSFERVLKEAGIKNFRWHDLRHSFASKLARLTGNLNIVRDLMGHTDYATTLRYAHLDPKDKISAMALLTPPAPTTEDGQADEKEKGQA